MIKKSIFLTLILITLLLVTTVTAIDPLSTTETYAGELDPETGLPQKLVPLAETGEKITEGNITAEYLKQEWRKILEDHPVFSSLVSFFEIFNPVFKIFLAEEFSFTLTFFFVLLLWFWFFASLFSIIRRSINTDMGSIISAILIAIGLAWIGVLRIIAESLVVLATFTENTFANIALSFVIIFVMILAYKLLGSFSKSLEKKRDEKRKGQAKEAEEKFIKKSETFEEKLKD